MARTTHRITAGTAALITAALLVGCTSDKKPQPAPTITSSTPTATSTISAPPTPEEQAKTQAIALVRKYYNVIAEVETKPATSLNKLHDIAMDQEFDVQVTSKAKDRAQGVRKTGSAVLVSIHVGTVDLTNLPNAKPARRLPTVQVATCIDVRKVAATDATGRSLVSPTRSPFYVEQLTVSNFNYPNPATWRVSKSSNRGTTSCAA